MIDNRGNLLTPQEMLELGKTEKGRRELAQYIWRARTAYAAQHVMESLGVVPSPDKQQEVCEIIWDRIFRCDIFQVMDYAKQAADGLEQTDFDCAGNA